MSQDSESVVVPRAPTEAMLDAGAKIAFSPDEPIAEIWSAMLAAAPSTSVREEGSQYVHKKRGTTYTVVGRARLQDATGHGVREGASLVIYRGDDGQLWARHPTEFYDGRFAALVPSTDEGKRHG